MPSRRVHGFLVDSAKFPYPEPALRDGGLVKRLCVSLENTLGDTHLTARTKRTLGAYFSPDLEFDGIPGQDTTWMSHRNEADEQLLGHPLLNKGSNVRIKDRGGYSIGIRDNLLPAHGIELTWPPTERLVLKILTKTALYPGLRNLEWLILTCNNFWIACGLARRNEGTDLTISHMIKDSTEPFQMVLGAILPVVKNSTFDYGELGEILYPVSKEEGDPGRLPEHNVDNGSGPYWGSLRRCQETEPRMASSQACAMGGNIMFKSELLVKKVAKNTLHSKKAEQSKLERGHTAQPAVTTDSSIREPLVKCVEEVERCSPSEVLRGPLGRHLLTLERNEILGYSSVYYVGQGSKKIPATHAVPKNNYGYNNEDGEYIVVNGDHLAYRYEIVGTLGKGSFGQVIKCRDHATGHTIAIKVTRNDKILGANEYNEIRALQHIQKYGLEKTRSLR